MKRLLVCALAILCLLFPSCEKSDEQIREENLQKLAEASEAAENGADFWESVESDIREVDENCVYFTPNGKSYHSTDDCVALVKSKTILSGTLEKAISQGKGDPCSKCVG